MCIRTTAKCIFDGAEIGSTGMEMNWSRPDLSWVNAKKLLIANNNFAPTGYALAA
jgi:hypothetical protein